MKTIEKQLLFALEDGQLTASDLRDRLGLEQNQQVHYRCEKLSEHVEVVERQQQPGAARATKVYALTRNGRDWVEEHRDSVSFSSLADAENLVAELQQDVSELQKDVEQATSWHQQDQGHYTQLRQQVEEVENDLRLVRTRASSAKGDTDRLRDDLDDAETRLSALQKQIDRIEENADEQSENQRELAEQLERIEQLQREHSNQLNSLEERIEDLEDNQPTSILDLFR